MISLENQPKTRIASQDKLQQTVKLADNTLKDNLSIVNVNGKEYRRTVPSKEFYVHQWNWDAATVAMGLIHVDPERAYDELRSLVSGQWENGHIAHITYNPKETSYYPQAEKWGTEKFSKEGIVTSGITQPPLFAIAVDYIYQNSPDKEAAKQFVEEMLPAAMKFHDYLKESRDPEDSGLITVIHPWESGTDNSPRWDSIYEHMDLDGIPASVKKDVDDNRTDNIAGKVSHRPTNTDYYRFMGLVDKYAKLGWDYKKIIDESPFAVKDIMFSSIWARANETLAQTLDAVGKNEDAKKYRDYAQKTRHALAQTWSEEHQQYCDIDVSQGRHDQIVEPTMATFMPLYAGAVTDEQLPKVLKRLSNTEEFSPAYPVPTTALNSPKFELTRYWRGPTWPITNLLIAEGLLQYAIKSDQAKEMGRKLVESTLNMIAKNGFYEYYDPTEGAARPGRKDDAKQLGFGNFSWSAAVFLKLLADYKKFPETVFTSHDKVT